jgi:hypothetical protein
LDYLVAVAFLSLTLLFYYFVKGRDCHAISSLFNINK